jgi:hypothetical protein
MNVTAGTVADQLQIAVPTAARGHVPSLLVRGGHWLRIHLTDEWLIALLAIALSTIFFARYEAHGLTVAFNDARSRELIARRVLMGRTPGLAQLGATWLPLPFLLMLPLIWNNTLFSDGIAGSFPSMVAYVLAAVYMFRTARLVSSSRGAGWVSALVLMLNPSLLYMQATPMSESASVSAYVIAVYYALRLCHSYHALDVVKCATAVAAGTLVRYENWVLAIVFVPFLVYVAWRRRGYILAEAWAVLYCLLAFAGCAAWILYNTVIFHDPLLSFFYGQSSHKYYANTPAYLLPARHHAWFAVKMYGLTVADTVGWILLITSVLGLIIFLWRNRLQHSTLPVYLTLVPFGFYCLVLYEGVNTESLPQLGTGPYYNIRFGLLMIPAVALFSAFLVTAGPVRLRRLLVSAALALVFLSSIFGSVLYTPFVLREATTGYGGDTRLTGQVEARWFHSQYHGGNILYTYVNDPSMMFYLLTKYNFADRVFITDAEGTQFTAALAHPAHWVTWIVLNSGNHSGDILWNTLHKNNGWRRCFVLRKSFATHRSIIGGYGRVEIFERRAGRVPESRCLMLARPAGTARTSPAQFGSVPATRKAKGGAFTTVWKDDMRQWPTPLRGAETSP